MTEGKIDFVITWVDGNDPVWQTEKNKAAEIENGDARDARYRDWGTLRYWFRGVEKFAPWVNRVFFVTCGHYPEWLNLDCPKLSFVKHEDFIPEKYLPTFSCRPIEFNLHKIHGLADQFVYFNDDMFLTSSVNPEDFFVKGMPCDCAILDCQLPSGKGRNGERLLINQIYSSLFFNTAIINQNFEKKECMRKNFWKWFNYKYGTNLLRNFLLLPWGLFTGFKNSHLPYSYLKSTFEKVWEAEGDVLELACSHKFRKNTDVSSRLLSFWQIAEGTFAPRSSKIGRQTYICNDDSVNRKIFHDISFGKYKMICVNDEYSGKDFEKIKEEWIKAFDSFLPNRSIFER